MVSVDYLIKRFGLEPLPGEGGYFAQTYKSSESIPKSALPERYDSARALGTAIYYLLTPDTFSALHRLPTDEIFHFYLGDPVIMLQLFADGKSRTVTLGQNIVEDQQLQLVVPRGTWQGSYLDYGGRYALLGTTMAPGFEFSDLELGDREGLIASYPERKKMIERLAVG